MRISKSHILFFVMGLCIAGLGFVSLFPQKTLLINQMKARIGDEQFTFKMNDLLLQKLTHEMKKPCDMSYGLHNIKRLYVEFKISNDIGDQIDAEALKNVFKKEYSEFEVHFGIPSRKLLDETHTPTSFITIDFWKYSEGSDLTDGGHDVIMASVRHMDNNKYLYKSTTSLPFVMDKNNHNTDLITEWFESAVIPTLMPDRVPIVWISCI